MTKIFSAKPGMTWRGREFRGLRGWAGKPLHPPLTDFPIVGYTFAAVFDIISYLAQTQGFGSARLAEYSFVAGTYSMIGGAVVSLGALLTGFWDWWKGIDRDSSAGPIGRAKHTQVWRTMNFHMLIMSTVTVVVIFGLLVRFAQRETQYAELSTVALSALAALLVGFGSLYGGSLVYDYQFNVESLDGSTAWDETEVDQKPADKK